MKGTDIIENRKLTMPGGVPCPFMSNAKQVFLFVEPESVLVLVLSCETWSHITFLDIVRDGYRDL